MKVLMVSKSPRALPLATRMMPDSYSVKRGAWRMLLWRNLSTQEERPTDTDWWEFPNTKVRACLLDREAHTAVKLLHSQRLTCWSLHFQQVSISLLETLNYEQSMTTTHWRERPRRGKHQQMNERIDIFNMTSLNIFMTLAVFIRRLSIRFIRNLLEDELLQNNRLN